MSKLWLPPQPVRDGGTVTFANGSVLRLPTGFGTEVVEDREPTPTPHPHRASKSIRKRRARVRAARRANRGANRG